MKKVHHRWLWRLRQISAMLTCMGVGLIVRYICVMSQTMHVRLASDQGVICVSDQTVFAATSARQKSPLGEFVWATLWLQ